jgi:YfiR/HmsC-like
VEDDARVMTAAWGPESRPQWPARRPRGHRRRLLVVLCLAQLVLSLSRQRWSWAEDLAVPAEVQAQLLGKLASYDRGFPERAAGKVIIAIVVKPSEVDSTRAASQINEALKALASIGGLPHEEVLVPWTNAHDLSELCAKKPLAIVYLMPGLLGDMSAIASELDGKSVLTVAGVLSYLDRGVVLGFELVSGRTKLVVNLTQAKKQNVQFRAEVLSLMRIVG